MSSKKHGGFAERERLGSIRAVEDMTATLAAIFQAALRHDDLPPDTKFAVFSPGNPFVPYIDKAAAQWHEMAQACAAHGYVGLSTLKREVYKPSKRAAKPKGKRS